MAVIHWISLIFTTAPAGVGPRCDLVDASSSKRCVEELLEDFYLIRSQRRIRVHYKEMAIFWRRSLFLSIQGMVVAGSGV